MTLFRFILLGDLPLLRILMRRVLGCVVFLALIIDLPYYVRQAKHRFPLLVIVKVISLLCLLVCATCACCATRRLLRFVRARQTAVAFLVSSALHAFQLVFFMRSASNSMCDDWLCLEREGDCTVNCIQIDGGPNKAIAVLHIAAVCVLLTVQVTPSQPALASLFFDLSSESQQIEVTPDRSFSFELVKPEEPSDESSMQRSVMKLGPHSKDLKSNDKSLDNTLGKPQDQSLGQPQAQSKVNQSLGQPLGKAEVDSLFIKATY